MKNSKIIIFVAVVYVLVSAVSVMAAISDTERAVLIILYKSTNGDEWYDNSGWKGNNPESDGFSERGSEESWKGVKVVNDHVVELHLYENELTGTIPGELRYLRRLQWLHLYENELTGTIPGELSYLTDLRGLLLNGNQLTGTIPGGLGYLPWLMYFFLYDNQLTGTIPGEIGNLPRLYGLKLNDNHLVGPVPFSITYLDTLTNGYNDFCNNHLFTDNDDIRNFLNLKQKGGDWEVCQTPACYGDADNDADVDGTDLSFYANGGSFSDLNDFAASFGNVCLYE